MGQKVNPHGLRVGVIQDWDAKWYADSDFSDKLHEDLAARSISTREILASSRSFAINSRIS